MAAQVHTGSFLHLVTNQPYVGVENMPIMPLAKVDLRSLWQLIRDSNTPPPTPTPAWTFP